MIDLTEVYVHWWAGRSQVQISESLGIDRKTVRKYLAPVEAEVAAGTLRRDQTMSAADWRHRIGVWFPAVADAGLRQVTWPAIAAHRDWIKSQLEAGVTQATIHQRLVDEHGLDASVASLRRRGRRATAGGDPPWSPGTGAGAAATGRSAETSSSTSGKAHEEGQDLSSMSGLLAGSACRLPLA